MKQIDKANTYMNVGKFYLSKLTISLINQYQLQQKKKKNCRKSWLRDILPDKSEINILPAIMSSILLLHPYLAFLLITLYLRNDI
jgi:hypothetical protein